MTSNVIKTIPGTRMDVRVIEAFWNESTVTRGFIVQFLYSREKNIWKNHIRPDGDKFFETERAALASAKRCHSNNN